MVPSILIAVLLALSPTVAHSSPSQEVTLVLCAGDDWCVAGESVRKTCENPAFMAALGRRFRLIPETQAEGLNFETRRYPALFVFDNKQRLVARLENIPYDMKCEAIVEWVRSASKSAETAVALLEKKEFGRGFELLRQQNPGLFVRVGKKKEWTAVGFENEFKAMCAADPEDREGYFTAFTSGDGYGRVNTATAKAGRSEGADFIKSLRARTTATRRATARRISPIPTS